MANSSNTKSSNLIFVSFSKYLDDSLKLDTTTNSTRNNKSSNLDT